MVIATILRFAAFPILHGFVFADLVCDGSAACSYSTADESAFASAGESADDSTACG